MATKGNNQSILHLLLLVHTFAHFCTAQHRRVQYVTRAGTSQL